MESYILDVSGIGELTDEALMRLSSNNRSLRLERNAKGEISIMSPTGFHSGRRNSKITTRLTTWSDTTQLGEVLDSSTGFRLQNSAVRSPDAAWISHERMSGLTPEQLDGFAPICPNFVVELMSASDRLTDAQEKMHEWIENGCRLGWLIEPHHERVYIYRADSSESLVEGFDNALSGENVLQGFILQLHELR